MAPRKVLSIPPPGDRLLCPGSFLQQNPAASKATKNKSYDVARKPEGPKPRKNESTEERYFSGQPVLIFTGGPVR